MGAFSSSVTLPHYWEPSDWLQIRGLSPFSPSDRLTASTHIRLGHHHPTGLPHSRAGSGRVGSIFVRWPNCRPCLVTITTRPDLAGQSETDPRISLDPICCHLACGPLTLSVPPPLTKRRASRNATARPRACPPRSSSRSSVAFCRGGSASPSRRRRFSSSRIGSKTNTPWPANPRSGSRALTRSPISVSRSRVTRRTSSSS